ncbi:MAG: hypothetical protein P1P84_16005 [Deferrisomatales bacterium]|nr:hypothetical protein [Deferrisomatales bacterium]
MTMHVGATPQERETQRGALDGFAGAAMQSLFPTSKFSPRLLEDHPLPIRGTAPRIPVFKGIPSYSELVRFATARRPLLLGIPLAASKAYRKCQLNCGFCFVEREERGGFLELADHLRIMEDFARLGGRYVRTATVGEPFLDRMFFNPEGVGGASRFPLIQKANALGLWWTSFSNLLSVTAEIAEEVCEMDVSFIGKLHALDPAIQEAMTGNTGHYASPKWARFGEWHVPLNLKMLVDAGFNRAGECGAGAATRLAVDIVATQVNVRHIPAVVKFCLANNIYPFLEMLENVGDAKCNAKKFALSEYQVEWLSDELTDLLGVGFFGEENRSCTNKFCPAFSSGLVYNPDGRIRYCYCVNAKTQWNLKEHGLKEAFSVLCDSRETIRSHLDRSRSGEDVHLPLEPCPMGAHGSSVASSIVS